MHRKPVLFIELGDNPPGTARVRVNPLELAVDSRGELSGIMDISVNMHAQGDYYVDVRFHGSAVTVQDVSL